MFQQLFVRFCGLKAWDLTELKTKDISRGRDSGDLDLKKRKIENPLEKWLV